MQMTDAEYQKLADRLAPKSDTPKNCAKAFAVGGLICVLGQCLSTAYRAAGLSEQTSGTMTSVTLIFLSALLTGLAVFDDIAKQAGAGTLVPITGFANSVTAPAVEFKTEGWVTGLSVKMFTIAGPVLVYGITASVLYGVLLWAVRMWL